MTSVEPTHEREAPVPRAGWGTLADKSAREESRLLRWDAALRRVAAEEQRAEAARQRAEAARQRAEAARAQAGSAELRAAGARERVKAVREDLDHLLEALERVVPTVQVDMHKTGAREWERTADERDRVANHREQVADEREAEADERERLADRRDAAADERERLADARESDFQRGRTRLTAMAEPSPPKPAGTTGSHFHKLLEEGAWLRDQAAVIAETLADEAESIASTFEASAALEGREWRAKIAATEREIAGALRRNASRLRQPRPTRAPLEPLPRFPSKQDVGEAPAAPEEPSS